VRWARHYDWDGAFYKARVWVVYQPELVMLNGADCHPEEFELSELVEVEVNSVPTSQSYARSWAQLRCLRSVPFRHIPQQFPLIRPEKLPSTYSFAKFDVFRGRSLLLLTECTRTEGQDSWIMINTRPRQVILYESGWNGYRIQICNFPLQRTYLD
jgi:hypothetical protein